MIVGPWCDRGAIKHDAFSSFHFSGSCSFQAFVAAICVAAVVAVLFLSMGFGQILNQTLCKIFQMITRTPC